MKKLLMAVTAVAVGAVAQATSVSQDEAKAAAKGWIDRGYSMKQLGGRQVSSVSTLESDGVSAHVVSLEEGGFVVMPTDDTFEPVILFSDSGAMPEPNDADPVWALLKGHPAMQARESAAPRLMMNASAEPTATTKTSVQRKWASLIAAGSSDRPLLMANLASLSDTRVDKFLKTEWKQSGPSATYTPNGDVCGCVALAFSQIMYYHRFPEEVTPISRNCRIEGAWTMKTMMGGLYDWASMPESMFATRLAPQKTGAIPLRLPAPVGGRDKG